MLIPALLLAAALALLAWFVRNDRAEYATFKALTRTEDRQLCFRRWVVKSFLLFWGVSFIILLAIGRLDGVAQMPAEFAPLAGLLAPHVDAAFVPVVIGAAIGGAVAGILLGSRLGRRGKAAKPKVIGDIAPLLPRNAEERRWTALLGANAGVGEELFFRLMLPLLIVLVGASALIAFILAGLIFGLVHFYQGWLGILVTTVVGFLFAALYLATGALWIAILLHAGINLISLWLRPLLTERFSSREA